MAEEDIMIEDDAISLDDLADSSNPEDINTTGIVDYVYEKYNRAENYRENDEDREIEIGIEIDIQMEMKTETKIEIEIEINYSRMVVALRSG